MKRLLFVAVFFAFLFGEVATAEDVFDYPLIKTDLKSLKERRVKEFKLLRAVSSSDKPQIKAGKVNLLPLVSTKGAIRDQDKCGNCWVWTGLASMEVFKNQYDGVSEATAENSLSVGFVNAFYNNGGRNGSFACNGGFFPEFAKFFAPKGEAKQRVIPWSNYNADFVDGNGGKTYKGNFVSNRTKADISVSPYYYLSNMSMLSLNVDNLTDDEVINEIKMPLNRGIPVALGFYMSGPHDWDDFKRFWAYGKKDDIFDIGSRTSKYNQKYMAGHAVLIIGYDDTSSNPDEHHWIALNSWGVPNGHADGTFKLKMHTNYKSYLTDGFYNTEYKMEWHVYAPVFTSKEPYIDSGSLSGKLLDPLGSGVKDVSVKLNDKEIALTDENGNFSFSDVPAYKDYKLNFVRAGYKFIPAVYTGTMTKATNYVEINVENDEAYYNCKGSAINLKSIGNNATALYKLGRTAANKLKNKATALDSLNNTQRAYLNAFNVYPRVRYSCAPACKKTGFASYKTKLRNAINKLASAAQSNWQKCLKQKKVKARVVASKKKIITLKRNLALKQVQKLPAKGEICN